MRALAETWGFRAMLSLLRARGEAGSTADVQTLLREFAVDADGKPTEAVREEWNAAVKDAMASAPETLTQMHLL